jgi:hypothetical protein
VTGPARAVYLSGMRLAAAFVLLGLALVAQASAQAPAGGQRIALVLATWGPEPVSVAEARAAADETEAYVREASFGRSSVEIELRGWVRALSGRPVGCDVQGVDQAIQRATDLAGYDLVAYVIPSMDCGWGGAYYPPGVWMLGRITKNLFAHELGHNWGVREEGPAWVCWARPCRAENYMSPYSVMGHGSGHFNAFEKRRFGWIEVAGPSLRNGDYEIARIDRASSLPHALHALTAADEYWIEYRPEVAWPVVHAGTSPAAVSRSRFPQRNLLVDAARSSRFAVAGVFEATMTRSDPERATLRFRWLDRTRPSRPEISVYRTGRDLTFRFPATDRGSGVERYQLVIGRRVRVSVPTTRAQGNDLVGVDAAHRVRLPRGVHRVSVAAIDRAGNRGPTATRRVRVR